MRGDIDCLNVSFRTLIIIGNCGKMWTHLKTVNKIYLYIKGDQNWVSLGQNFMSEGFWGGPTGVMDPSEDARVERHESGCVEGLG